MMFQYLDVKSLLPLALLLVSAPTHAQTPTQPQTITPSTTQKSGYPLAQPQNNPNNAIVNPTATKIEELKQKTTKSQPISPANNPLSPTKTPLATPNNAIVNPTATIMEGVDNNNLKSQPNSSINNPLSPTKANPATTAKDKDKLAVPVKLVLKLGEKQVYVYQGEKVMNKYPVAIGKKGWETPVGEWKVFEMRKNPGWTSFKNGSVIPAGPKSPLGERWIGFWTKDGQDVIGFHGTSDVKSIGTAASHGCVRMYNDDVRLLFDLVKIGTPVNVIK